VTAFEFIGGDFHCGRPWSPFGAPYALPADCSGYEQGTNGAFESLLDFGSPTRPPDMHGWPTFHGWPSPTALVEEGDYYTGIERAWKAGLRVMVTNLVDNEALCSIMTTRHNPCNDMAAVRIQDADLHALQDYIDAQAGGPGKGWFRLVTDPFQARRVIDAGKLAVVEGIEVSRIFGCGEHSDAPECDKAQIDAGLREIRGLGVRTFFPVHEFDNAFGGTKMIGGDLGIVVNAGNRLETGNFWTVQPCPASEQDGPQLTVPASGPVAQVLNGPVSTLLHGGVLAVYPPGPHCNTRGLTDLGAYVIEQMIKQHVMIQTDHMDSKTADAALQIAQAHHYSGVVSAHCCSSPQLFARTYATGGFITPPVDAAAAAITLLQRDKAAMSHKYAFGFGWGSDMNGLGTQPGPAAATPISYPFKSFDGAVTFTREQWGQRKFDLNTDGLANYGMYADWLQEMQMLGGRAAMSDMMRGAEAYLQMWERTVGVPSSGCLPARQRLSSRTGRLGASSSALLYALGQPVSRPGRSYRFCVGGAAGAAAAAVFTPSGRVGLWGSRARRWVAGGVGPGARASALSSRARSLGGGLWVGRRAARDGSRVVYRVRGRWVASVAVAAASMTRNRRTLAAALRAGGL
jgi:hypothetical protein